MLVSNIQTSKNENTKDDISFYMTNSKLTSKQKTRLTNFLKSNRDIFAKDLSELGETTQQVFSRLRDANLKLNPDKCDLGNNEIKYIGFMFSADGVVVDKERIQAVKDYPIPKTKQDIRFFLGMAN